MAFIIQLDNRNGLVISSSCNTFEYEYSYLYYEEADTCVHHLFTALDTYFRTEANN